MPTKTELGTSVSTGVNGVARNSSRTTNTSARKYFARDQVQNNSTSPDVTPNVQHLIEQAASLTAVARVAQQAAQLARSSLSKIRDELSTSASQRGDSRRDTRPVTEADVRHAQAKDTSAIIENLGLTSDAISNRIKKAANDAVLSSSKNILVRKTQSTISSVNSAVPEIDHVAIDLNEKKGTVDCFYSTVVFNLSREKIAKGEVKAIRIFRAEYDGSLDSFANLSHAGVDRISSGRNRSRSKNQDYTSQIEHRLREGGVQNSVSSLNPLDTFRNRRLAASQTDDLSETPLEKRLAAKDGNYEDVVPFVDEKYAVLDRSVARDLKTLGNIQRATGARVTGDGVISAGRQSGGERFLRGTQARQIRKATGPGVQANNRDEFREIAFISPDKLSNRVLNDVIEFSFQDESVSYGKTYRYYVTTVDNDLRESVRSAIVKVTVDGLRIPDPPSTVSVNFTSRYVFFTILSDDKLVEKFEIYRREENKGIGRVDQIDANVIASTSGFTRANESRKIGKNGFLHIGDAVNHLVGGGSFTDRTVLVGRSYIYRVYAADIFGNKSSEPKDFSVFIPEPTVLPSKLNRPTITLEIDSTTGKARLTFGCQDSQVTRLFLSRRDLTIGQEAFTTPSDVNFLSFTQIRGGKIRHYGEGEVLHDTSRDRAWTGIFENVDSEQLFIDKTVAADHIYQYKIYGVDRFGNQTPSEYTRPVQMTVRPMINAPVNLEGELVPGPGFTIAGISLRWEDGNIDVSAEERVGNRQDLRDTNVRTLYQVERKKNGEERWEQFPLVEETTFFDYTEAGATEESPKYRPAYLVMDETYVYRVQAVQSGGFVSNYSTPIEAEISAPVVPPVNFTITAGDTKVKPFYVMLDWATSAKSHDVDHWIIERCAVNNFAAARLNPRNPQDFAKLRFEPFKTVYRESSRFRDSSKDQAARRPPDLDSFKDFHSYMDTEVSFGNTYFYRIAAVSVSGQASGYAYRGVKITDETFERKQSGFLTNEDKNSLTDKLAPVVMKVDLAAGVEKNRSSFGMIPNGRKPVKEFTDFVVRKIGKTPRAF